MRGRCGWWQRWWWRPHWTRRRDPHGCVCRGRRARSGGGDSGCGPPTRGGRKSRDDLRRVAAGGAALVGTPQRPNGNIRCDGREQQPQRRGTPPGTATTNAAATIATTTPSSTNPTTTHSLSTTSDTPSGAAANPTATATTTTTTTRNTRAATQLGAFGRRHRRHA